MSSNLARDKLLSLLRRSSHFSSLDADVLDKLVDQAVWVALASGKRLVSQGELNLDVYVLLQGKMQYEIESLEHKITARGILRPGDLVGDVGYFNDRRAVSNVYATRNSQLLRIPGLVFESTVLNSPKSLKSIANKIVDLAGKGLTQPLKSLACESFAVIPIDVRIPVKLFADKLADSLRSYGRVCVITESHLNNCLKVNDDLIDVRKTELAESFFEEFDYVIFCVEPSSSSWSKAITRQVDKILLVTTPDCDPTLSQFERDLPVQKSGHRISMDLVVLQSSKQIRGTSSFLAERSIRTQFHVWLDQKSSFERLARTMTGRSLGLALGGGGARAAAHIGVLRAFEKHRIEIDHLGGTSIGAFIAALSAKGLTSFEIEEVVLKQVVGKNLFSDYTLPLVSLVSGRKVTRLFKKIYEDLCIEDLPKDYFALAVNLTEGRTEVFDRGPLWRAIRASSSLPAILPPYAERGYLFVDGGLLDNVPDQALRERGAGQAIAVDVGGVVDLGVDREFGELVRNPGQGPTPKTFFGNMLSSSTRRFPGIREIVTRSMLVGSRARIERTAEKSDLYIRLPVERWELFDFDSASELVKVGYEYAERNMEQWLRKLGLAI